MMGEIVVHKIATLIETEDLLFHMGKEIGAYKPLAMIAHEHRVVLGKKKSTRDGQIETITLSKTVGCR